MLTNERNKVWLRNINNRLKAKEKLIPSNLDNCILVSKRTYIIFLFHTYQDKIKSLSMGRGEYKKGKKMGAI
jgi:hypothetical protein